MVDVGDKPKTERVAVATARLRMLPATRERILAGKVEKGDVLAAARLAGIMAAKRTPDFVPLCHPIALAGVEVTLTPEEAGLSVRVQVKTVDRTGVEMEALTAACAAALTVYDMCKSVDRGMVLEAVQLEHKAGGRSGTWDREAEGQSETPAPRARGGKRKGATEVARSAPTPPARGAKRSEAATAPRESPAPSVRGGKRGKRVGEAEGLREALATVVSAGKRTKRGG
jgi:cyclic pyranopterin phosphate synthase